MAVDPTCPECRSASVEDAVIEGASVRLQRASALKRVFATGNAVQLRACLDCGALFGFRADPAALKAQVG